MSGSAPQLKGNSINILSPLHCHEVVTRIDKLQVTVLSQDTEMTLSLRGTPMAAHAGLPQFRLNSSPPSFRPPPAADQSDC